MLLSFNISLHTPSPSVPTLSHSFSTTKPSPRPSDIKSTLVTSMDPPAYAALSNSDPGHTTKANSLIDLDIRQYHEVTLPVLVYYPGDGGRSVPIVCALNENVEDLKRELAHMFGFKKSCSLAVQWQKWSPSMGATVLDGDNIAAALRLVKARGCVDVLFIARG